MTCVKCGCQLINKSAIRWDESGSSMRFICSECAEEEGVDPNDETV